MEDAAEGGDFRSKVTFDLSQQGAQVMGHSRNVADSLRRVDDKRKKERESRKEVLLWCGLYRKDNFSNDVIRRKKRKKSAKRRLRFVG